MSDHDSARHRAPQRALTPLSDVGDALTGRLAVVGRSGAVLAVSTGILATGGLPTQAQTLEATSAVTSTNALAAGTAFIAAGPTTLLASAPDTARGAPVRAPMTANVLFETSDFQAVPAVVHHAPARTASHAAAQVKASAPMKAARAKAAHARPAAPAKPAAAKPARKKAAHAKAPAAKPEVTPVKAKPAKAKPAKKATSHKAPASHTTAPAKHKAPVKAKKKAPASTTSAARGSSVLSVAARYVGTPYVYGGSTPHGFDCSGYTSYVYRQLGISLPRTANQQMMATTHISRSKARAGDLVFFVSGGRAYHVGIYAGGGMMYDSPHTGARVSKRAIWSSAVIFGRVTR